ncbi:MAG: tRNA (adenosine(37)-N6)-threonylcarbamoyltransferase complex ATPase subunit type 1 TsaE, partial [Corynebacterium urealyticum]
MSNANACSGMDLGEVQGHAHARTPEDMRVIGRELGEQLAAGTVVILTGPLGAGKTTITQGIAEGLAVKG